MKVLHLSKLDDKGGAAIATKRLHEALLAKGIDSWILCDLPSGNTRNSIGLRSKPNWLGDRLRARLRRQIAALQDDPDSYCLSLNMRHNKLLDRIDALKPDIVHMHWVGGDYLRIEDLPILCARFPVVWTMHDMWSFCGAEHCAYTEDRWRNGYIKQNRSPQARGIDFNRWIWQRKLRAWTGCTIHTISVSNWMNECVSSSKLFQGIKGVRKVIHNGMDINIFNAPYSLKQSLVDDLDKGRRRPRLICMSTPVTNKIKGIALLIQAMQDLHARNIGLDISTFGGPSLPNLPALGSIGNMGHIGNPRELANLYASADLLVSASRMESFGQTAAESLACGTPVVCFDTSGLRDIVQHKQNGYRAECFSPKSLADGIVWCIQDTDRYRSLQSQARPSVVERFNIDRIAQETTDFYAHILASH